MLLEAADLSLLRCKELERRLHPLQTVVLEMAESQQYRQQVTPLPGAYQQDSPAMSSLPLQVPPSAAEEIARLTGSLTQPPSFPS